MHSNQARNRRLTRHGLLSRYATRAARASRWLVRTRAGLCADGERGRFQTLDSAREVCGAIFH